MIKKIIPLVKKEDFDILQNNVNSNKNIQDYLFGEQVGVNYSLNGTLKRTPSNYTNSDVEVKLIRNSISFDEVGNQVAANVPVYKDVDFLGKKGIAIGFSSTTNLMPENSSIELIGPTSLTLETGQYTISMNKGDGKINITGSHDGTVTTYKNIYINAVAGDNITLTPDGECKLVQIEKLGRQTQWVKGGTSRTDGDSYYIDKNISGEWGVGITFKPLNGTDALSFSEDRMVIFRMYNSQTLAENRISIRTSAYNIAYDSIEPPVYVAITETEGSSVTEFRVKKDEIISVYLHYAPHKGVFLYAYKNGNTLLRELYFADVEDITYNRIAIGSRVRELTQRASHADGVFWDFRIDLENEGNVPDYLKYFKDVGLI